MKDNIKIYISGQITGLNQEHVQLKFNNAAEKIKKMGYIPLNPLNNGLTWEDSKYDHMDKDLEMLKKSDIVIMLSNWKKSKGAKLEKQFAEYYDKIVVYSFKQLNNLKK